jgi:hypothetical protein
MFFKPNLMPCRRVQADQAIAGYEKAHVPLVSWDGAKFTATANNDDKGLFYFLQKLSSWFGLNTDQALFLFYTLSLSLAFLLGMLGIVLIFKETRSRLFATIALFLLTALTFVRGDLYIMYTVFALAAIPLFLYFLQAGKSGWLGLHLAFAGLLAGTANFVRANTATGGIIFILIALFFYYKGSFKNKLVLFVTLILGLVAVNSSVSNLYEKRDAFLALVNGTESVRPVKGHAFWHAVYVGLGYVKNPVVRDFRDEVAFEKVAEINPAIKQYSPEYEDALKKETISFVTEHPFLFAINLLAKLGIILIYILVFANIGLIAAYFYRNPWPLDLAFLGATGFNMLFGILVVPRLNYLLGLVAFAVLYAVFSINKVLENSSVQELFSDLRLKLKPR